MVTRLTNEQIDEHYLKDLEIHESFYSERDKKFISKRKVRDIRPWALFRHPENILDISNKRIFVWSDLHFFHHNIIRYSNRPYNNVDEMNEAIVNNYNQVVGPEDVCIWVGDVTFGSLTPTNEFLDRCAGYKILVVGNHDLIGSKDIGVNGSGFKPLKFDETHLFYNTNLFGQDLVFTHYPLTHIPDGYYNIHGHIHCGYHIKENKANVSCEVIDYKPKLLQDIVNEIRNFTP